MRLKTIGLISILVPALLAVPLLAAEQQTAGKMARIGVLRHHAGPTADDEAFVHGLRDLGWAEGKNITIEYRWAARKRDRYLVMAGELLSCSD